MSAIDAQLPAPGKKRYRPWVSTFILIVFVASIVAVSVCAARTRGSARGWTHRAQQSSFDRGGLKSDHHIGFIDSELVWTWQTQNLAPGGWDVENANGTSAEWTDDDFTITPQFLYECAGLPYAPLPDFRFVGIYFERGIAPGDIHYWYLRSNMLGLLALLSIPTLFVAYMNVRGWKAYRRYRKGFCSKCSYDLRAHHPGENCPECGTAIPPMPEAKP